MIKHPDSGKNYYEAREYAFTDENGFKATVPKQVWEDLENEYYDSSPKVRLKYRDLLIPQ